MLFKAARCGKTVIRHLTLKRSVYSSQGDGQSFVTRLVHIDPEQANGVLQQNGKRCVQLVTLKWNNSVLPSALCGEFHCPIWITAAWMEDPNSVMLNTYPRAPTRKVLRFCRRCLLFYSRTCVLRLCSACFLSDKGLSASGTLANGPQQVGGQGC